MTTLTYKAYMSWHERAYTELFAKNGNIEMKNAFNSDCCVTNRVKSPLNSNPNVLKYMSWHERASTKIFAKNGNIEMHNKKGTA